MLFLRYFTILKFFCATNVSDEQAEINKISSSTSLVNNTTPVLSHAKKRKISENEEQNNNPKHRHTEIQEDNLESLEYPSSLSEKLDHLLATKLHNCLCDLRFEPLMSLGPLKISKNKHVLIGISEKIYEFFAKKRKSYCSKSKMTEIIYKLLGYPYSSMYEAIIFLTILTLRSSCFKGLRNENFRPRKWQYNNEIDCFGVVSCYTIQFIEDIANQWTNNEGKNFKDINLVVINQSISYFSSENDLYIYNRVYVDYFIELFSDICNVVLKYRDK